MRCTRCGADLPWFDPRDDRVTADLCDDCANNFFAAMAEEFPYGQCPQCGAKYQAFQCELGKQHVEAFHAEGACSMWRDGGEAVDAAGVAAGFCSYGCRPTVSRDEVWTVPAGADEMPF